MALQIVLAEDEALVAMALAECLEAAGHQVAVAGDGAKALEAVRHLGTLDLLITDLRMPVLGGEDLIRALWAERPGMPVLVVTGSPPQGGQEALRREVGWGGPLLLRHKPLDFRTLNQAVETAISPIAAP